MNITKIIIALISIFTGASFAIAQQKPLVHWDFNQITNNTLKDVSGNCDGKIMGGSVEQYIRLGLDGNAFYFDNGMHYIQVPDSQNLSLNNNFTIEYVIMPYLVNSYRAILWKGNREKNPEAINYFIDIRDGRPELKTKDADGKWLVYACASKLKAKEWYHIIITYNDGQCEFYINGTKAKSSQYESGEVKNSLLANDADVCIGAGANARSKAYFFYGLIDDIKIWNGRVVNIDQKYSAHWLYLKRKLASSTTIWEAKEKQLAENLKQKNVSDYKSFFKKNEKLPNAPFVASSFLSSLRLVKEPTAFKNIKDFKREIVISAARNEYEGFQVITFANPDGKSVNVKASVSKLVTIDGKDTISESNISVGFMKSIKSEKPDIPVDLRLSPKAGQLA